MRRRGGAHRALGLAAVLLAIACSGGSGPTAHDDETSIAHEDGLITLSEQARQTAGIVVAEVASEPLPESHVRFGQVRARPGDEAVLVAPVAARIVAITAPPLGTEVAADTVLISAVPVLGAADGVALASAAAELAGQLRTAEEELTLRQATLERARALSTTAVVSRQAVQEASTSVETTQAQVDALRRATAIRARGGRTLTLLAPRSGTLVAIDAVLGAVVQPGDALARVVATGPRFVDVDVPTSEAIGVAYEIEGADGWAPATLVARGATALGLVRHDRLLVDASVELVPGAVVAVRIAGDAIEGPVVPETALVPLADGEAVYVEREAGAYEVRAVRVAARLGGRVRIAEGLRATERVVTSGAMALSGQALRAVLGEAD